MPVAEAAAAGSAAASAATGGGTAAGGTAAGGAGGAASASGAAGGLGGAASASGAASGGSAVGGTAGGTAAKAGSASAATGERISSSAAQSYSRARNTSKNIRLDRVSLRKKDQKKNDQEDNDTLLKGNSALMILASIIAILLIVCMLVSFILSGPLSMTYPLYMGIQEIKSISSEWNITDSSTNGDIVAQELVKYYKKDYAKIHALHPNIIEYLHDYSNLRDIIAVYSMLAQTDEAKTEIPSYTTDIDKESSDNFLMSIAKKIISTYLMIAKWVKTTTQQVSLLKSTYREMFYYKVHIIRSKWRILIKVNIYNKNVDDYINEHPDLTEEQKEILKISASTDYQWDTWDSSEYDAIAYQGDGYSNNRYTTSNGDNVYYIDSNQMYNNGYSKKRIPQSRQSFVDQVAQVAIANYNTSGILPSVVVAQACYESRWGESNFAQIKKNIFGIKGKDGTFRTFSSWADCMDYYFSKSLILNERYDKARFRSSPYRTLQALIDGGYCQGDGSYEANCYSIIQTYGFEYFDKIAKGEVEAVDVNVMNAMNFCQEMADKHAAYSQARRTAYGDSGGKEYVFDCSSFMWYAYKQSGINISGTSYPGDSRSEYAYLKSHGCEVSKTELMPGDLVFYKHDNSDVINHVDMYAGNGMKYNDGSTAVGATYCKFTFTDAVGYMRPSKLLKKSKHACTNDSQQYLVTRDSIWKRENVSYAA